MGLLDKIMNSIFNETKKVVDNALPGGKKPESTPAQPKPAQPVQQTAAPVQAAPAADPDAERIYDEDGESYVFNDTFNRDAAYFRTILFKNFGDYGIEENVSVSRFDPSAHPKCTPVTFLLTKDGRKYAFFVMALNKTNGMPYRGAKKVLDAAGIPHIHCISCYKNEESYVVNRIKTIL